VLPLNAIVLVVAGINEPRFTAAPVTPLTVVVKLLPAKLLVTVFTMGTAAAATPFTVVVKLFPEELLAILLTLLLFAATPLTVLVMVLPLKASVLVVAGISEDRFTAVPVTPLTVVVRLLPVKLFDTALTLLLVAATPFTVLVSVFPLNASVLLVAGIKADKFTAVPVTPLTVVVRLLPVKLLATVFTMGTAVPVTPLTVVVKLFGAVLVLLTVVVAGAAAAGNHVVPFQAITCPVVGAVFAIALPCN
jgi:hypothetical protein